MFWRRQPRERWDQLKAEYEWAVKRVYGFATLKLAICGLECFAGFNVIDSWTGKRHVCNTGFKMTGVLDEYSSRERHVRLIIDFVDDSSDDGTLGSFLLTHITDSKKKRREEQDLELHGLIHDPNGSVRKSVVEALRDAALSRFRFIHLVLETNDLPEPDGERDAGVAEVLDGEAFNYPHLGKVSRRAHNLLRGGNRP